MSKFNKLLSHIMSIEPIRRQSIVSFIWQILLTLIGFLSTMYFAHTVGADILGAYFLFIAYFGIIGLVSDGGIGAAAIKRISEGEDTNEYFSAFFVLRAVFAVIIIGILLTFRNYFVDLNNSGTFIWLIIALIVSLFVESASKGIAGCGKMGIYSTANFINNASRILIQLIGVFLGYGIAGLTGGFVIGMILGATMQLRFFDLHFTHFEYKHVKSLSSFSFWSFLIAGGGLVFTYSDSVMIGYFLNNAEVGIYRVILQFTSFATLTAVTLNSTLMPKISRWDKINEKKLIEESISRVFTYSLILAIPMFIGGLALGDKLLYFFYGSDFSRYEILLILFIVQLINIYQYSFTNYLRAMNKVKDLFKVTIVAVFANIIINAILIPKIGIAGAAIATMITMGINTLLEQHLLKKIISVRIERTSLLNIINASTFMGIIVIAYRLIIPLSNIYQVMIPVFLGGIVYGIALFALDTNIRKDILGIIRHINKQ